MLGLTMDTPLLSTDILRYAVIAHGETEIVSRNLDRSIYRYSYSAAKDRCLRLSATLQSGLSTGDRLGSLAWNIHNNFELLRGPFWPRDPAGRSAALTIIRFQKQTKQGQAGEAQCSENQVD